MQLAEIDIDPGDYKKCTWAMVQSDTGYLTMKN